MALVYCHECGKVISESASACPHCGCIVKQHVDKFENASIGKLLQQQSTETKSRITNLLKFVIQTEKSKQNDDSKPLKINVSTSDISQKYDNSYYTDNSIEHSYAFANRLKNLIFSQMISESELIAKVDISENDLKKYKFSTGFPPRDILSMFEKYFNVSFRYLCVYNGPILNCYDERRLMYSLSFNNPHKGRFDDSGNCVFLDYDKNQNRDILYHLDPAGNVIGKINEFPHMRIEYIKFSSNGNYVLLISSTLKVFFINMKNHTILWKKSIRINSYNIKEITDNELIFRYRNGSTPIYFSLDYNGDPYDFTELTLYFYDKKPPIRYHVEDYLLIMTAMLPKFEEYEKELLEIVDFISRPASLKYIPNGRLSDIHKEIGKYYFSQQAFKQAKEYFQKALLLNPKTGVKGFLNKIDKML